MKPSSSRNPRGTEQFNAANRLAELNPFARLQAEWFMEERDKLRDFTRKLDAQFKTAYPKKNLSEHISDKMKEKGVNWSPPVCAQRLSEIVMVYFHMKLQRRESVVSDLLYDEMVDYVASKYKVAPQKDPLDEMMDFVASMYKSAAQNEPLDEMVDYVACKCKAAAQNEPVNPEPPLAADSAESGNQRSAFNRQRGLGHDQHVFGINMNDVNAANEVSAGHQPGRVITVKWGDSVRRIGIDGSPEEIREVIKAAFGLRTAKQFWLEDEFGILRTIDRDMPLGNYTLYVDEGLTIRIYFYGDADESPSEPEEMTFYTEEEFRGFLQHCGFTALTDLSCRKHVNSIDDLHHGEAYQGFKAATN